jgi:hypothetical protein
VPFSQSGSVINVYLTKLYVHKNSPVLVTVTRARDIKINEVEPALMKLC